MADYLGAGNMSVEPNFLFFVSERCTLTTNADLPRNFIGLILMLLKGELKLMDTYFVRAIMCLRFD
jgi:hypothetical protein